MLMVALVSDFPTLKVSFPTSLNIQSRLRISCSEGNPLAAPRWTEAGSRVGEIAIGDVISYLSVNVDDPLSSSRAVFKLYPVDSITQRHLPHASEVIGHPVCFQPAADQHKKLAGLIARQLHSMCT